MFIFIVDRFFRPVTKNNSLKARTRPTPRYPASFRREPAALRPPDIKKAAMENPSPHIGSQQWPDTKVKILQDGTQKSR